MVRRPRQQLARRLAARIRAERNARGWTQERTAEHCDLVIRHYQKLESGKVNVNVTLRTLEKLGDAFGIDAGELVT